MGLNSGSRPTHELSRYGPILNRKALETKCFQAGVQLAASRRLRFANFHDPNRFSFCALREERNCYAVSLILGVDRFAVAQADRPPREGDAREQPAIERVQLIPGLM